MFPRGASVPRFLMVQTWVGCRKMLEQVLLEGLPTAVPSPHAKFLLTTGHLHCTCNLAPVQGLPSQRQSPSPPVQGRL